jgi:DNA-binding beta-propeller fold protein YncE
MSFRRVGWVAAITLATWLELSCGQVYRPVVIPTNTTPPNPANFHAVFGISANVPFNPGTALQIDVSGDTDIGVANMGVNPTHAAILPNHSRVIVASAGSLFPGDADVITAFAPAAASSSATGFGPATTFTLPNVGADQSSGVVSISEAGSLVTMTLSAPLINAQADSLIVVSGVVIPCANPPACTQPPNPTGYDGSFPISFVNGTTIQYVDCHVVGNVCVPVTGLTPTSGGAATVPVPLFCRYLPDFVTASASAVYVANFGDENGTNCNLSSTDSVAVLNATQNTIGNIAYLPAGAHPVAMVETPDSQNLYVINQGNNTVADLSPADLTTIATISLPGGSTPVWAVARADNQRVYVLTQGDGNLVPIDTATNKVLPSQTNLAVGAGANFILYDANLNRLYVTNPSTGTVSVFSASGGVDLGGTPNDTPKLLATISMAASSAGSPPPCPAGCSPVSVAALPDGSRFYVASFTEQSPCQDPNVAGAAACMVPRLTVFDARNLTVKPVPSPLVLPTPSSSLALLTSPQFAATQYAVPPLSSCVPAPTYAPGSTRFRMFTTAAADSSHVYVSICDAGSIADIATTTNTISTGVNSPDTLVTNIPPPFGACAIASCSTVATITGFSITSNVVTFTAANGFIAGQKVTISGLSTSTGKMWLNGLTLTVLGTGLTAAQFECNLPVATPDTLATSDSGTAVPLPPPQNPIFLLTGQ